MKDNNYFDELIVSYLLGELSAEEEVFVLDWINSNEENKKYFREIKKTWELLSLRENSREVDSEVEWDQFKVAIAKRQDVPGINEKQSLVNSEEEEEKPQKGRKIYNSFILTAVAASIVIVLVLGLVVNNSSTNTEKPVAYNTNKEARSTLSNVRYEINKGEKVRSITLPDGSEVKLFSNSQINFAAQFNGNKRDITLSGKARFKVAKDETKPFTVISGAISTTALGTEFTVTAYESHKNISVRLFEGKVVVKSSILARRMLSHNFYLLPGQEFIYSNLSSTGKVKSFSRVNNLVKKSTKKEATLVDNPSFPSLGSGSWYMFNNQPLAEVFDQLEQLFDVDIIYLRKEVSKMYFIGSFNITDSLEDILSQIARINALKVSKRDNKFFISK
ncbi:MAG: FecR family protein [Segetibacter sp.]|jgi:ferric-dicitrate binding protein FerR (iron transport regulator)|nr:FecR family protein [Segetibacter sp.]